MSKREGEEAELSVGGIGAEGLWAENLFPLLVLLRVELAYAIS